LWSAVNLYLNFVVSLTSTYSNSNRHAGALLHSDMNVQECDATEAK